MPQSRAIVATAVAVLLVVPLPARAEGTESENARPKWSVDVSGSGGLLLGSPQSDHFGTLGAGLGVGGRYYPAPWIAGEVDLQYVGFSGKNSGRAGSGLLAMAGARFEPVREEWGAFYFGADLGVASTGGDALFAFDADVGAAFTVTPTVRLGPVLRYDDIFFRPGAGETGGDARIVLLGVRLELGALDPPPRSGTAAPDSPSSPSATVAAFRGTLTDLDGKPLSGLVTLTPEANGLQKTFEATPNFETHLPPGVYHLEAQAPGYLAMGITITIDGVAPVRKDLPLRPIPSLRGATLTETQVAISRKIQFEFGKATVLPESFSILDEVVDVLIKSPELKIEVQGHTDEVGADDVNQTLSEERAEAVMEYLVKHGVRATRVTAVGYGKARPIASNASESGRAQNRRVQFVIVKN